jgi:hypothetical protein
MGSKNNEVIALANDFVATSFELVGYKIFLEYSRPEYPTKSLRDVITRFDVRPNLIDDEDLQMYSEEDGGEGDGAKQTITDNIYDRGVGALNMATLVVEIIPNGITLELLDAFNQSKWDNDLKTRLEIMLIKTHIVVADGCFLVAKHGISNKQVVRLYAKGKDVFDHNMFHLPHIQFDAIKSELFYNVDILKRIDPNINLSPPFKDIVDLDIGFKVPVIYMNEHLAEEHLEVLIGLPIFTHMYGSYNGPYTQESIDLNKFAHDLLMEEENHFEKNETRTFGNKIDYPKEFSLKESIKFITTFTRVEIGGSTDLSFLSMDYIFIPGLTQKFAFNSIIGLDIKIDFKSGNLIDFNGKDLKLINIKQLDTFSRHELKSD